jgi:hypothetical protein
LFLGFQRIGAVASNRESLWEQLRTRLNLALQRRGAKLALTRKLGVSSSSVYEWLADVRTPNAEMTLRLLQWVEQSERKQKPLGGVRSTAKGTTTQRKARNNAHPTSGPPKK